MKPILIALVLLMFVTGPADARSVKVTNLITQWKYGASICLDSPQTQWSAPVNLAGCDLQERAERQLNRLGWCYGRKSDAAEALHKWHPCKADSYRQ